MFLDLRKERGHVPHEHDGEARELRLPLCHLSRSLHHGQRDRHSHGLRKEAEFSGTRQLCQYTEFAQSGHEWTECTSRVGLIKNY